MTPQTAAVFAQVLPILFIAVFVGEHRITRDRPRMLHQRVLTFTPLLATPPLIAALLFCVAFDSPLPGFMAWVTWGIVVLLALALMAVGVATLDDSGDDSKDDAQPGSGSVASE